ncbi:MAG: DUF3110 domain-containing protein [cyanobacterium endosymbiont of Rhopalodia musculus]|uniref:DUF3110 domain-containing protein n=1 Tax=cyanobacterium endosymbiont of Epithemia clementina EcSB TaxID=3034674 RepID=UPI002480B0F2|nr:DUF3110 domain-containing protein [cyanobacterium endosymbiont of Epithemia clementina EcSB]WGT67143.1 DUF3110 domain-containing protein [cyanobacterium endosymbiont of Epithemia clementina EcSB]
MAKVYVLLYNARTENEGIHTVQMGERTKVLMFESEDDATRYSLLLEAQDFPSPSIESLNSEEVEEFCRKADYDYELIKEGMLAIPPETNVDTDWENEKISQKNALPETTYDMSSDELDRIRRQLERLI